jgi:multidrug efflux pump subunit AcrB
MTSAAASTGSTRPSIAGSTPTATAAASTGPVVPLATLASVAETVGPQTISHAGQLGAVTISFGVADGASLGDVLTRVQKIADETLRTA